MTITFQQLNEYRTQTREIHAMLKSLRRNIEKRNHQFYFASARTYGRVFKLYNNLISKEYVFETLVQPLCHTGIVGNYNNIKSACFDIERRHYNEAYKYQGNEKFFFDIIARIASHFYRVLTIPKNRSL